MELIKGEGLNTFEAARNLEREGDLKAAASIYENLWPHAGKKLRILERLIVLYRKLKDRTKEIKSIDAAIRIHQQLYSPKNKQDKTISSLSFQLNKSLGHMDRKGKTTIIPPEIADLELRKERLLKAASKENAANPGAKGRPLAGGKNPRAKVKISTSRNQTPILRKQKPGTKK